MSMMISQTFKGLDFLHPNHCLQLVAAGLTNKTAFCWILNEQKTLASLEFRPCPHDAEVEQKYIDNAIVPAYTSASILSFFSDLIHTHTNGRVELGIPDAKSKDTTKVDVFTEASTLNDATFQLIMAAIACKAFSVANLNAHLHYYNHQNKYQES